MRDRAETIRRLRLGDLKKILRSRYGHTLPDDDAGRDDLELLLDLVSFVPDARYRMKNVIETWAPWMETEESYALVEAVLRKPEYLRKPSAADLGVKLNLTWGERQHLAIRTIAPADLSPEEFAAKRKERRKEKERAKKARQRRKAGVKSRVASRTTSLAHQMPWERLRISRATWYRRRETDRETGVSRHKLLDSEGTDLSHLGVENEQTEFEKEVGRVGRSRRKSVRA